MRPLLCLSLLLAPCTGLASAGEPKSTPAVLTLFDFERFADLKAWKGIGGQYYGEDPDFLSVYLAHGPGGGNNKFYV